MDVFTPEKRSAIMRAVKPEGTSPERALAAACRGLGLRPRLNDRSLPGSPDMAFPAARLAVFAHGCFWHACPRHGREPKSNRAFWHAKFRRNRARDARVRRALNRLGWSVMAVWEHEAAGHAASRILSRISRRI